MKSFKNKIWIAILAVMIFIAGFSVCAGATSAACNVVIDGVEVAFDADSGAPFIDKNNRTLVPLRKTMETYGCEVGWDQATRTASVKMDGTTVLVGIGNSYITVDGEKVAIDTAAQIVNNRTYLPIRAVLEAFGAEVNWINNTRTVDVMSPEYISGEPRIIPGSTAVNMGLYNCVDIPIRIISENDMMVRFAFADTSVASGMWIEDNDPDHMTLRIFPADSGTTSVKIDFPDIPNAAGATIKIKIAEPASRPQKYASHPDVPDFGKYFGVSPVRVDQDDIVRLYEYDISSVNDDKYVPNIISVYMLILQDAGFEHDSDALDSNGNVAGYYYKNAKSGETVFIQEYYYNNVHKFYVAVTI